MSGLRLGISAKTGLIVLALCGSLRGIAQENTRMHSGPGIPDITVSGYSGVFIKHSPKLTTRTGQRVPGIELTAQWRTTGRSEWQVARHYPTIGLAAIWMHPGEGAHGDLIGAFPHLTISMVKQSWFSAFFRMGSGVSYISRPYNSFTNPSENALGSYWSNITQFRFHAAFAVTPNWVINAGGGLTHFSNGGYALPNFGMNIPGLFAGVLYQQKKAPLVKPAPSTSKPMRRFGLNMNGGLSRIEYITIDGPKYPIWMVSAAATWRLTRYTRLALGADLEQNKGVENFILNNGLYPDGRASAREAGRRQGVFAAGEFFYGPVSIYLQASWHVGKAPVNLLALSKNYNKLGVRYYLPMGENFPVRPYAGVTLKAYKGVAEHIGVHLGFDW